MFVILYGLKNVIAAATDKEKECKETQECLNGNGSIHYDKISADQLNAEFFADAWYKPEDYSDSTLSVLYNKTAENKNLSASDEVCLYILASLYRSKKFKACDSKINETKKVFFQTVKTSSVTTEVDEANPIYLHTLTKPGCSDGACEKGTSNATNGEQFNPFPSFIQNQAFLHVNRPHGIFNRFQAQLYFTVYTILEMEKHVKDSEKRELAQKIIERIECYLKNSHENYNFKNLKISYINKRFYLLYNDDTSFFVLKKIYEFGEKEEQPKTRVGKKRKSSKMYENEKQEKVKKLANGEEEVWTKEYQTELTDYKILSMICDDNSDSIVNLDLICAFRENLISVITNSIIESRIQPFFKFDDTDRRFMQTLYLNAWLIHNEDFYGKLLALKDKEIDEMLSKDEPDKDDFLKNIPNYLSICGSE